MSTAVSSVASESPRVTEFSESQVQAWIDLTQERIDPLRADIESVGGRSAAVTGELVPDPQAAPFGAFMIAWPEADGSGFAIQHLGSAEFFLRILELCYAPVISRKPGLAGALYDGSRLELAISNDVLQVQALGPSGHYSMIRHHALMHFAANNWLAQPSRGLWTQIYEGMAQHLMSDRAQPPGAAELDECELAAFADFRRLAPRTADPDSRRELLLDAGEFKNILQYQAYAAVAIAVLQRVHDGLPADQRSGWFTNFMCTSYLEPDCLLEEWQRVL
ncbi:MAG: hypothetical protein JWR35_1456 [Marmoricola sp.]|nr:hypothetical protein [Marmoricola sp.]